MTILRSTVVVSLLALVGSILSLLNQLFLARYFGAGSQMDAYLVAISLPLTISGLFVAVLGYQLVPTLLRAEGNHDNENAVLRSLAWGLGGASVLVALAGAELAVRLIPVANHGLSSGQYALAIQIARIAWICLPLAVLAAIYTAGLHIRQRFKTATLAAAAPMAGSLVLCLLAHARLGVSAAVFGQFAGYLAMTVALRLALGRLRPGQEWAALRKSLCELPLTLAALLVFVIYPFSDSIWGPRLGPGAVSYLGYAQRLLVGFSGLAVVGATTVLFPRLARHATDGNGHALLRDLGLSLRMMLVCMAPVATVFCMLAPLMVEVLFQRGAFHAADTMVLGALLRPMLFGMIAMSCSGLLFKALFARGNLRAAAVLSLAGSVAYFALSGLLGHFFGILGVGTAYAASWWLVLSFGLRHLWPGGMAVETPFRSIRFLLRLAAASFTIGLACRFGARHLPLVASSDHVALLIAVATLWAMAAILYVIVSNTIFSTEEVRILTRRAWQMVRRA